MNIYERVAVSSVTFRDLPLEEALRRLRGAGFTRLDLTAIRHYCDHFDPLLVDVGEDECVRVRDLIARYDMRAISLTTFPANPLSHTLNGDDWTEGVDAYVRLGLHLGATWYLLPPGSPAPQPEHWRATAEHAKPWLRDAAMRILNAGMQPVIALQSGSLARTSADGLHLRTLLGLPSIGLATDPAHAFAMGEDPVAALRQLGDALAFVVLRDTNGVSFNLPPGLGRLDYPAILAMLDDIDYLGPLVLAIDDITLPVDTRATLLKKAWEYLDGLSQQQAA